MRYRNIHALSDANDKTAERAELIDDNESKPEIACFLQCGANLRLLLRNLPINQRLVVIAVQGDNMVQRFPNIYDEHAENGGGVRIATGLVTDGGGTWRSHEDTQAIYKNTVEAFGEYAKYYQRASDGLPEGSYYFIETGTSNNTVDAQGKAFAFEIDQTETSQPSVKLEAENDEFNAAVELEKVDSETGDAISGAQFTLSRDDGTEGGSFIASGLESGKTYALDATGSIVESCSTAGEWQKAYDKRTSLLKTFVDDYGLTVSADHQGSLDKLVSHGKKVERDNDQKEAIESLASSINLEFTERYSTFVGQATATNNTGYDFDYINFDVELFDSNGIKVETTSLYANHWLDGETIALDCYTSIKEPPSTVKVIPSNYKVADV